MDKWREIWFPYKDIGGMAEVSEYGVLNVKREKGEAYVGFNALQNIKAPLIVKVNKTEVLTQILDLKPMEVFETHIPSATTDIVEVFIENSQLYYTTDVGKSILKRPFKALANIISSEKQQLYMDGWEAMKFREYEDAMENFDQLLRVEPNHLEALVKKSELEYRRANYLEALGTAQKALQLDTYHAGANYFAGLNYRILDDPINALESLGWAARDMKYRSVAYTLMAEIYFSQNNLTKAKTYANKALNFNAHNLNAHYIHLISHRKLGDTLAFDNQLAAIKKIYALDKLSTFEAIKRQNAPPERFLKKIQHEFPEEVLIELALKYLALREEETALEIVVLARKNTKAKILASYLTRITDTATSEASLQEALNASPDFVFPYRTEFIPVLEWANTKSKHWKLGYYLAQNYLAIGQKEKGLALLQKIGNEPDNDTFYRFRAALKQSGFDLRLRDYQKAIEINEDSWQTWDELIRLYHENGNFEEAHITAEKAYKKYPTNYTIGLSFAKTLVSIENYDKSISILDKLNVLPYEHAAESKGIYDQAHLFLAQRHIKRRQFDRAIELLQLSKKWPEHLGIGEPFNPDNRLQDYLLAQCLRSLGKHKEADNALKAVAEYTKKNEAILDTNSLFGLLVLEQLGLKELLQLQIDTLEKVKDTNRKGALALALYRKNMEEAKELKEQRKPKRRN